MSKKNTETPNIEALKEKLVLTGADIMTIGESAEIIVGGKNFNTAKIHEIKGVRSPQFRAISSINFHKVLDETSINAALVRSLVEREYSRIDWNDPEINRDPDYLQKLVILVKKLKRQTQKNLMQLKFVCVPLSTTLLKVLQLLRK